MSLKDKINKYNNHISFDIDSLNINDLEEFVKMLNETKNELISKENEKKKIEEKEKKEIESFTCMDLPLDWSNIYDLDEDASNIHVDTIGDGLIYSLKNLGKVDIEYISKITGFDMKDVILKLKNSIYQDPSCITNKFYEGYKVSSDYLSGNLLNKLKIAEDANKKYNGHFQDNVDALRKIMPKGIILNDIYFTVASPWIPEQLIKYFIRDVFNISYYIVKEDVKHDTITGAWNIKIDSCYTKYKSDVYYGTSKIRGIKILERILNCKDMSIYDTLKTQSGTKRILNKPETLLAEQKAKEIQNKFVSYIFNNDDYKKVVEHAYNERYGYNVERIYNGDFLEFPNMNKNITLFKYQKNAVARIIFNKNTLLAHNVGAGKTYVMIASGEELIRTKLSKKNLYVVPNNIILQWKNIYKEMYPNSNLLITKSDDYNPQNRRNTLELIRDGNYQNIIIPYSSFDRIPLSKYIEIKKINKLISKIDEIEEKDLTNELIKLKDKLNERLNELNILSIDPDEDITFDKLGIERLFVDEAHNYKNIPIITKMGNVKGINQQGSSKCMHMLDICDYMNSCNFGIIMATGTPITNSITDAYTFQRYLQDGELQLLDINNFDAWVSMFAENKEDLEIDIDTSNYRITTRFSKFHNLPELAQIMANIADFYYDNQSKDLPKFNGYSNITIKKTDELLDYLKELSSRVDEIRYGNVLRTEDNMLKVTTDGRKAALDLRLVNKNNYSLTSKVYACCENIINIYLKTNSFKGTQLVFCDISTPKDTFNIYDELKNRLISIGIPKDEIVYIHDATTDKERDKLFDKTRKGLIRILIGSTFKLGTGVNVQDKLYAIHHLDVPWRPSDMVQRDGRIIRQGNNNEEVFIYRYIQEASFDAYSWQLLETKQNFINELLSNSLNERTKEDVQDIILSYGEVKALAIGNPLLKTHAELKNKYNKLIALQKRQISSNSLLKTKLLSIPNRKKNLEEIISKLKLDIDLYNNNKKKYDEKERQELRKIYFDGMMNNLRKDKPIELGIYQGFKVIVPAYLLESSLSLELHGNGINIVSIGNSELGVLVRIDNVLDNLNNKLIKRENELIDLSEEEKSINLELNKNIDYISEIESLKNKIDEIENELKIEV